MSDASEIARGPGEMMGNAGPGMLAGLRVIEVADERAEYAGLLLAGLGCERADLQKRRARIDQTCNALARQQFAPGDMTLPRLGRAALGRGAPAQAEFVNQPAPFRGVGVALAALCGQGGLYSRHRVLFP